MNSRQVFQFCTHARPPWLAAIVCCVAALLARGTRGGEDTLKKRRGAFSLFFLKARGRRCFDVSYMNDLFSAASRVE